MVFKDKNISTEAHVQGRPHVRIDGTGKSIKSDALNLDFLRLTSKHLPLKLNPNIQGIEVEAFWLQKKMGQKFPRKVIRRGLCLLAQLLGDVIH